MGPCFFLAWNLLITATGRPYWDTDLPTTKIETPIITAFWTEFFINGYDKPVIQYDQSSQNASFFEKYLFITDNTPFLGKAKVGCDRHGHKYEKQFIALEG